jgi:hypothetical protein
MAIRSWFQKAQVLFVYTREIALAISISSALLIKILIHICFPFYAAIFSASQQLDQMKFQNAFAARSLSLR